MPIEIKPNTVGQDIANDERKDMLMSYHENNFHLIPCGSTNDIIPEYFKSRHPLKTIWFYKSVGQKHQE
jgi:hypothetical protein